MSYFEGGNSDHTEDEAFALEGRVSVRFENAPVVCRVYSEEVKAEVSFVYICDGNGRVTPTGSLSGPLKGFVAFDTSMTYEFEGVSGLIDGVRVGWAVE